MPAPTAPSLSTAKMRRELSLGYVSVLRAHVELLTFPEKWGDFLREKGYSFVPVQGSMISLSVFSAMVG